jgi:hypothetical protein
MGKEIKYIYSVDPLTKEELQSFVPNAEFSGNISKDYGEYQYEVTHLPKITRKAKRK